MSSILKIILLVVLVSCASTKNDSKHYLDIKNEDFKVVNEIPYLRSHDVLENVDSAHSKALNEESLERIMSYEGDFKGQDELDEIAQLCHLGEFSKSYNLVKMHSRSFVKNPIFWNQVGNCFLLEKKFRKALLFYNRALGLKDDYVPALNNLGVMYMKKGDQTRALVAFKKAINSDNHAKTPRYNLASLYLRYGLATEAKKQLLILYKDAKSDVDVLNMLGTTSLMESNFSEAESYFSQIKSEYISRVDVGLNFALALHLNGNTRRAKSVLSDISDTNDSAWLDYKKVVKSVLGD